MASLLHGASNFVYNMMGIMQRDVQVHLRQLKLAVDSFMYLFQQEVILMRWNLVNQQRRYSTHVLF